MLLNVAKDLEAKIMKWLDTHGNKIELDINEDSLEQWTPTIFAYESPQTYINIGFKEPILKDTVDLEELQRNFQNISFNRLPLPGLDVPSYWNVYPQTPMSSLDKGVRFEAYANGRLHATIVTKFFAIYGRQHEEHPIMDKAADEGIYLQVRRDIEGIIKLNMPLVFK